MKKIKVLGLVCLVVLLVGVTGCGNSKRVENIKGTLEEIMEKVYVGIDEDMLPMGLTNFEVTDENKANYIGTDEIEIEEGLASESKVGSIAHSVVLLRVSDDADVESIKKTLEEKVSPNKWLCVGVEKVTVLNKGNLIIVILDDETGDQVKTNFQNL